MTLYLALNALLYLLLGAWCALKPGETSSSIGFSLINPQGVAEFIAVYGGLELGLGVFFMISALSGPLRPAGVLMAVCLYGGIVALRCYAIIRHGSDIQSGWYLLMLEGALLVWAGTLYARSSL